MTVQWLPQWYQGLLTLVLISARIMPAFLLLPWFNNTTLSGTIRRPLVALVALALWPPSLLPALPASQPVLLLLILKELLIGLIMAMMLLFPLWVLHIAGDIIDNQRGATLSSNLDPVSGVDSSELANLLHLLAALVVIENGGLLTLLTTFQHSYQLWPPQQFALPAAAPLLAFLGRLVAAALALASPLICVFLLMEILLGILSRYAPQMNAFSLALTIKSLLAFLMLLIAFQPLLLPAIQALNARWLWFSHG